MEIVKDLRVLKKLERLSNNEWQFDREYKYHIGKTYNNCKSLTVFTSNVKRDVSPYVKKEK